MSLVSMNDLKMQRNFRDVPGYEKGASGGTCLPYQDTQPDVNLWFHTAPIVRPLPWPNDQCTKSFGFARRNRSNQSLALLV
jgi:hypothetical protein